MPKASAWSLRDTLAAAALLFATAAFTLWQNTRIAVLWDISFLLDTGYRWSLGQLPYKELPFPYAPLTFLLHTGIIRLFGRVYYPHILYAALAGATATVLTWRILLAHLRENTALGDAIPGDAVILAPESQSLPITQPAATNRAWRLATLLAAPLTVLGIYAIYPHPIYDSDCILAVLLAIFLLQRCSRSPAFSFLTGAACVLPLFIKQNIGGPFLLVTLASVLAIAIVRRLQRVSLAPQLCLIIGSATAFLLAMLTIHAVVGLHNYLYWTITFAAQRRLPGLSVVLGIYRQNSLLWTLPAAVVALVLLHMPRARNHPARNQPWTTAAAVLLLAAPFLWTIASLALTDDPGDRADQLLTLWPHILILAAALALYNLRRHNLTTHPTLGSFLPLILLATIHGTFLSQQLWGSTYAIWPLFLLLIGLLLGQIPTIAKPLAAIIAATLLLCGGLYAVSHERLSYIHLNQAADPTPSSLPELHGVTTPGPWLPDFEELIRFTDAEIPSGDPILLIPGEDPFFFATGRTPRFPILLFDPATDPYTPEQTADEARAHNIRWLIVKRNLQLNASPHPQLEEIVRALKPGFSLYRTLNGYDIYRRQ
jgi:hypothetical protein